MPLYPANVGPGLFLPTTQIIDTQFIYDNEELNEDLKQILIRVVQAFNDHAQAVNLKDTGMYNLQEFVTGQVYYPNPNLSSLTGQTPVFRQVFRIVIDFGALPNNANKTVAHGLTFDANTTFTAIYATSTDSVGFVAIPIPMQFTGSANKVDLRVDAVNVNIQTNFNATAFTTTYVVLEYIKQ